MWRMSLPSRGAWIETPSPGLAKGRVGLSLPSRGAWIETQIEVDGYKVGG